MSVAIHANELAVAPVTLSSATANDHGSRVATLTVAGNPIAVMQAVRLHVSVSPGS